MGFIGRENTGHYSQSLKFGVVFRSEDHVIEATAIGFLEHDREVIAALPSPWSRK